MSRTKAEIEAELRKRLESRTYIGMTTDQYIRSGVEAMFELVAETLAEQTSTQKAGDQTSE